MMMNRDALGRNGCTFDVALFFKHCCLVWLDRFDSLCSILLFGPYLHAQYGTWLHTIIQSVSYLVRVTTVIQIEMRVALVLL